ncbi:serine/arginine-rich splicing factor 11-like isoform X2 [Pygocentrus nattereri]|uniref:serine/arginine-rich splicing factor 11-like isoform X2 n=1 Tax=Pygocentrus nattereri TaxID=42514 RepID=UPI0008145359|nr:serine/arginine-rich splicing factor 11-like isoform X2 [Pygocentrus nattereri]
MNCSTNVVQVTNVSPSTTSEQMRTLFGFLGTIEELRLFPPDDSTMPVTSRVCFVRFQEQESVGVAQHLTNTVFVDRALIVVPYAEGVIPDESKALSLLAPANAVAGLLPGGGLLPTPNPLASPLFPMQMGGVPLGALGGPAILPGAGMNPQALSAEQLLKLMSSVDPKMNPMAASMGLKADASSKEIEEAMKRVREAQSLISAAIEPGNKKDSKRKYSRSRSRSRSRRRRSRSRSRHKRSSSRSRRRSRSRSRRRSRSPRRRRSRSRDRNRRSASRSRDRKKEEKDKKRSKTPPKSYSTARRSRSTSRRRRKSVSRSPRRSPKRRVSRSPSPRKHKKEKKRDREREKDRERDRDKRTERERSSSKKKKSKDKERERTSDSEKRDVKVTRDYDEEEQGYDSEKEREMKDSEDSGSSPARYADDGEGKHSPKQSKQNGDDHHEEQDMEVSD